MTETEKKAATQTESVGTLLTIKSNDDLVVTFPNGQEATFKQFGGEVHVVLHTAGTFVIDGKSVEAV